MPKSSFWFLVSVFVMAALVASWLDWLVKSGSNNGISLGGYPVCEASAAIVVPCTKPEEKCLLVGDNEENDRLFLYKISNNENGVYLEKRREIHLSSLPPPAGKKKLEKKESKEKKFKLSDIEAIARLPSGELIIYGSHSRNSRCVEDERRRIFAHGFLKARKIGKGTVKPVRSQSIGSLGDEGCAQLFTDAQDPMAKMVCAAINHTEQRARLAAKQSKKLRKNACKAEPPTFNLEGAVAIGNSDATARVWVGLRAPLIDGKAVLLRQVMGRDQFRFDGVAFVDLAGRGIRELTFGAGTIWGIGGPAADGDAPHVLWRLEKDELKPGTTVQPTIVSELPNYSEGLAILDDSIFVLIDGDQAKKTKPMICQADAKYIVRRIGQ